MVSEKSLANLEQGKWKKGQSGNPKGRTPKMVNAISKVPKNMQEQIYGVLAYALTLPDETAARKYLEKKQGELGQYGFAIQIAIKQLTKEGWGWGAMMDILDRLYGKPRISAEVAHSGGITLNILTDEETKGLIEEGLG